MRRDDKRTEAWLLALTRDDFRDAVECPSSCCWRSDVGHHINGGGYFCSHCGTAVRPEDLPMWLQGHIEAHEKEAERLKEWLVQAMKPLRVPPGIVLQR